MIFTWTPDLITAALDVLTDQQRAALECLTSLSKGQEKPGPTRLKKHGFRNLDEYETNLEAAREIAIAHFAELGIRRMDDLAFVEPDRSTEGRIQKVVRKKACAVAA